MKATKETVLIKNFSFKYNEKTYHIKTFRRYSNSEMLREIRENIKILSKELMLKIMFLMLLMFMAITVLSEV